MLQTSFGGLRLISHRSFISALILGFLLLSCSTATPRADRVLMCSGPFSRYSSEEMLAAYFGTENVSREEIYLGEGESVDGTVLFAGDPLRRLEITWDDPIRKSRIESIRVSEPSVAWQTQSGLAVGTDLRAVETTNLKPFLMHGYAWDYAGTVADWQEGFLDQAVGEGCRMIVRFGAEDDPRTGALEGEDTFSSQNPVIQAINPKIREIVLMYDDQR